MPAYIADGYTEPGYLEGEPGKFGPIEFHFRPMLHKERESIRHAINHRPVEESERAMVGVMLDKLAAWNLADARGAILPITAATVSRLHPDLFERLYLVIAGTLVSDPRPQAAAAEQRDYVETLLSSVASDALPGDVRAERDEKN